MDQALDAAREGQGRIVAISAEAGAGKTTLVRRFTERQGAAARVYWGSCENLSTPEVLLPLRDIARASGESLELGGNHIRSFELMLRLLSRGAASSILVIEDIHWADSATLDLIRFLGRRISGVRALVLATYREEELQSKSPVRNLLGEAGGSVVRLTLPPLSRAAVNSLAEKVGQRGEDVFALTAGNPFLVTEALAAGGDMPTAAVRDSTLARAARLPEAGRTVLEAVSIFPRHAETAIVDDLVFGMETGLDQCVEKGMLALERGSVRFRHELARRAVETSIAPSRRQGLHQKVVDILKRRANTRPGEIAHHAQRAGDIAAVLRFARLAGDEAARAGAPREAAAHYAAMLQHRGRDPSGAVETLELHAQQAYLSGAADTALISMIEAAQLRRDAGNKLGLGRDLTRLTRYAWMCGRREDADRYIEEAVRVLQEVPPGAELAWAYSHQSQLDMLASRMEQAIKWGERALELATRLDEQEIVIHALANIGSAKADSSACDTSDVERSFQLAVAGQYHDHVERASCNLACSHYWQRRYQAALGYIERGLSYAAALELRHWEGYLRGWRAMIKLDQGHWAGAEEEAQLICSTTYSADMYRFPALIALARVRIRRGDPDADIPLEAARRLAATMNELQRNVYVEIVAAERAWLSGNSDAPDSAPLRELHAQAAERKARWITEDSALWLYLLGVPVIGAAEYESPFADHCEGRWQAAAMGWRSLGRPYEEAVALSGGDEAAQRRALEILDRLGALPAAARLRRQMRAGGALSIPRGPIAGTRANTAGLTRRQVQVLYLVDEGLSNPEIAARLCISAKTAEHHVSAVLVRLGAATRVGAAEIARHRGLLSGVKK